MALSEIGTFTTIDDFISSLKIFAEDNGWIVDFFGLYNSHNRLHIHRDDAHFEHYYADATHMQSLGCRGYTAGSAPTSQPDNTGARQMYYRPGGSAGYNYVLLSCGKSIYYYFCRSDYNCCGGFGIAENKLSSFTGGQFVFLPAYYGSTSDLYVAKSYTVIFTTLAAGSSSSDSYATCLRVFINGSWSSLTVSENACVGDANTYDDLLDSQPNAFNGAVLPIPVMINVVRSGTYAPLCYAPNIFRINAAGVYKIMEIITISGDDYMVLPAVHTATGNTDFHDYLFKLG